MAAWSKWLANGRPPWAAYRTLMASRLVALDKQPGVRPVGIGSIFRRLFAKCLIKVIGHEATSACGNVNLCAGLPAGIEGAVHAVRQSFDEGVSRGQQPNPNTAAPDANAGEEIPPGAEFLHPVIAALASAEDLEGLLLVDARNEFNELSRKAMLWTARHRWCNHQGRAKSRNQIVLIPKYLDCNLGIHWLAVRIASNCPVKCQGKIQKAPIPSTTHLARLHYHPGPGPDCCWILAAQTIAYPDWASSSLGL
eukprot:scaffold231684_cov46-Attheya_sp.AAC.1